jgi:hypothetical protein
MRRTVTTATALLSLAACGYTDGGGGSKTLEVQAVLRYHASENAIDVDIAVRKSGVAVDGASVVLTDGDSGATFTVEQQNSGNNANYRSTIQNYHRKLAIRVENGGDKLHGQIEGPGSFVISNPGNAAILKRSSLGSNLNVRWVTEDGIAADEVTIRFHEKDFETTTLEDRGSCDTPASELGTGSERVQVTRRNRVSLTGGVQHSNLELSYNVENEVIVQD